MRSEKALSLIALCALVPARARAETSWSLAPSVGVSERRDDNLFSAPVATEQDWITGLEPRALLSGRSPRWSIEAGYAQTAERYAVHPRLDTARARQEAWLRLESHPSRSLDATLTASYLQTAIAGELYRASGLDLGRLPARRLQLTPALAQQLSSTTTLLADLTTTRDQIEGVSTLDSAVAGMRLDHHRSSRTLVSLRGQLRWYGPSQGAGFTSQFVGLGYRQELGRELALSLEAGPSLSRGNVAAEWLGSLHYRRRRSECAIEWRQDEAPVIGASTRVLTRRLGASASYAPHPLRARVALDLVQNRGGVETEALQASAQLDVRVAEPLAIGLTTAWSRQRGGLLASSTGEIRHLVTELRLVIQPRKRKGAPEGVR